jgi:anti-sigma factor (TIGR02949 family)
MVCDDVKRIVYFYLDGQLGQGRARDFESHLENCRGCGDRISIHKRLRTFILGHLRPDPAPPALRDRLHARVEAIRRELHLQ